MITLRNKIGQMLIMGFSGTELHDHSPVSQWLSGPGLGGVLLFDIDLPTMQPGKNLVSHNQIRHLIQQLNGYAHVSPKYEKLPLLVAVDYEGGAIDRLKNIPDSMATMKAFDLASLPEEQLEDELTEMAMNLKTLGFNLNFAPVVDLHLNDKEGIIGKQGRSYSSCPHEVARLAEKFVSVFNEQGIACAYKHFPGHGSATGDTHEGFVDVTSTYNESELTPYYSLLKDPHKMAMIMTAHVINKHLDNEGIPATLSYKILTQLLRQKIGYDGVIVSDDLQMQAIASHYSLEDSLRMTINAGADMVIFANQLGQISATEVIDCVEGLVMSGFIAAERIDEAYRRIVRFKQQINCDQLAAV